MQCSAPFFGLARPSCREPEVAVLDHADALLQQLDLQDIGDFVVMASTLMEIKSRELLPNESVELEEELDPRDDLIRRLLEYKRYRDLARELDGRGERRCRKLCALGLGMGYGY